MNKPDTCPGCGRKNLSSKFKVTDNLVSKTGFNLVECEDCTLIWTDEAPDRNEIGKYYRSEEYISHSDTRKGIFNRIYHLVRKQMLKKKFNLVKSESGRNQGNILDIGCATGYFPGYMKEQGWDVTGIEADATAAHFAREKFGINVFKPGEIGTLTSNSFDVVSLWHVLEHIHEPKKLIGDLDRILRSDGVLIIALPNNNSTDAGHYKNNWAAWDVPRHLWHFNLNSFESFISGTGFEISAIRKMPYDAFYVSILSEQNKGSSLSFIRGMIIGSISWITSLFRKTSCSSLIFILRKSS